MKKNSDFYNLSQSLAGALYGAEVAIARRSNKPSPSPSPSPLLQLRSGYAESPGWYLVQALEFDPQPLTVELLRLRDTYAAPVLVGALLELMASDGWLAKTAAGLALTDRGRDVIVARIRAGNGRLQQVEDQLGPTAAAQLEQKLSRLNAAALAAPTPPGTWCLAHSRRRAYLSDNCTLSRIRQFTSDWNALRDDAHMAAFQPLEPRGYVWEAFALLQQEDVHTGADVQQKLFYRGYTTAEYAAGLDSLVDRGWVTKDEDRFQITAAGRDVLTAVEERTDAYFFAPFAILTDKETEQLAANFTALEQQLNDFATD